MVEEKNETSKRKRRTKAEIELANSVNQTSTKITSQETKEVINVEKKDVKNDKQSSERSILMLACLDPEVLKIVTDVAAERNFEVVELKDQIIYDYLSLKDRKEEDDDSLRDFLNNTSNRLQAEEQSEKLWYILTKGKPIETSFGQVFTQSEIVKATNLNYNKTKQLLTLFQFFGIIQFTKGTYEFVFNFNKKNQVNYIKTEILSMYKEMNNNILRYKTLLESIPEFSNDLKKELYEELQRDIVSVIKY